MHQIKIMSEFSNGENKHFLERFLSAAAVFFEHLFTWKGYLKKFIEWTNKRGLKIEKIESCSYSEAGFSYWKISKNYACVKMEVSNEKGEKEGLYLLSYRLMDAGLSQYKFVPVEEIKFNNPYRIIVTRLVLIEKEK